MVIGSAFACGERDVLLVDSLEEVVTQDATSACAGTPVKINEDNQVVVERSRIKVSMHEAQHILEEYLEQAYQGRVQLSEDEHSDVPGHEAHHHQRGNLQDSHGTISYAFLVEGGADFFDGKSIPFYVDAEDGTVYGLGCGLGAGDPVYTPQGYPKSFWHKLWHFWDH
ncbi:hypothetical protein D6774_00480 [Candidatus Woesearchaeota archaeon]|nr:MAG: hypothetical protein D6774_00480 [Candidatus Woesearchaeota archaeon]